MEEKWSRMMLNRASFPRAMRRSREPMLMEIRADWCGSCHIMAPVLEKLAAEYHGKIKFDRVDIETKEQIAREFGVTELPFLLFFRDGKLADFIIGTASRKTIEDRIAKLLETESK